MASTLAAPMAGTACGRGASEARWSAQWDRLLIEHAATLEGPRFDEHERLTTRVLTAEYHYHTKQRNKRVHDLRGSADYALALLELKTPTGAERAQGILERLCAVQDRDSKSKWYGLWSYYLEEPLAGMDAADWNWADFIGGTLLLIEARHGERLGHALRAQVRDSIGHAARSIERRDVTPAYTNIAVKGSFVCAAAAERLELDDLGRYAQARMGRIEALVEESGSFAEYNSPPYAKVTLTDLTRMRMLLREGSTVRAAGARLERRLWAHLGTHWDGYRKQFAGPMSRCYETSLSAPYWLEKALGGRLGAAGPVERADYGDLETGIHDFRCPEDLAGLFLRPRTGLHREQFRTAARAGDRPVQGATYLTPAYSLGTVNQGDFWVQSRPLVAYYGAAGPARTLRLRVVKDGYDFASALLWSVHKDGCVLGLVNFRSPGGDKHPGLDPIKDGEFECGRMFLELSFTALPEGFSFRKEDNAGMVQTEEFSACFRLGLGLFAGRQLKLEGSSTPRSATFTVDFVQPEPGAKARRIRWSEVGSACVFFALELSAATARAGGDFGVVGAGSAHAQWGSPAGVLELNGLTMVASIEEHAAAFRERIDGAEVPVFRLEDHPA